MNMEQLKQRDEQRHGVQLLRKSVIMEKTEVDDEGAGSFTGYGAVFNNVDLGGDRIVKGAFAKHLASFINNGWIAEGHDWKGLGVGYPTLAIEDDFGMKMGVAYYSDSDSQKVRQKVNDRVKAGKSVGLSIGYLLHQWEVKDDAVDLLEIEVKEVSIVTVPMNPLAGITSAKGVLTLKQECNVVEHAINALVQRLKERADLRMRETVEGKDGRTLSRETLSFMYSESDDMESTGKHLIESAKRLRTFAETYDKDKSAQVGAEWERLKMETLLIANNIVLNN